MVSVSIFALIWSKFNFAIEAALQTIFIINMKSHGVFSWRQNYIRGVCLSFVNCASDFTVGERGLGSSPRIFLV